VEYLGRTWGAFRGLQLTARSGCSNSYASVTRLDAMPASSLRTVCSCCAQTSRGREPACIESLLWGAAVQIGYARI